MLFNSADVPATRMRADLALRMICGSAIIPLSALAGWVLNIPLLESTGMHAGTRMNPFSGVCLLVLAAAWVLMFRLRRQRAARAIATLPVVVALLRLFEVALGVHSGFDFLLFHNRILGQANPNHIAPNAALAILGLALGILLSGLGPRWDEIAAWTVICAGATPFFAILGYASRLDALMGIGRYTPMSLNTASSAILLSAALLISLKHTRPMRPFSSVTSGGIMARRLFPLALGIPVVASLLLSTAVNHNLMDKVAALAFFSVAVVVLIAVVFHRTASRVDEFDLARARQSEIIGQQNHRLTDLVQQLRTRSDDLAVAHSALNAILDATTRIGIVAMEPSGVIRLFNTGAEEIFGYNSSEVIDRATLATFCEPDPTASSAEATTERAILESFLAPVRRDLFIEQDRSMLRKNGVRFIANVAVTPQRDESQQVRGYVAVIRDITEERQYREALLEAKRTAEEAARSKSDFLSTMSHEIRTPMNGVIGMTGLLLDTPLSAEQREYAGTIRNSGEALLGIINDILDFSKIDAGKLTLEEFDFDLFTTVEECVEIVAANAQRKGLEIILAARVDGLDVVRGDQGRLRQILLNLLSNAVKFTAAGEVAINVKFDPTPSSELTAAGRLVRIEVRDTGIGISPATQRQLFSAFTQADSSTTRRFGGTGLGLAISKRLCNLMGGEIGVESEEGRGSTFWFTMKLITQTSPVSMQARPSGKKLLIVDDNETNRRVLQLQLQHNGYASVPAEDAAEALKLLAASDGHYFDGILCDLRMPDMDGIELTAIIRRDPRVGHLPVLMLTSHEDRERARSAGVNDALLKPVRESLLVRALERIFSEGGSQGGSEGAASRAVAHEQAGEKLFRARSRGRVLVAEDNPVNQRVVVMILKKLGYGSDVAANGREVLDALELGSYGAVLMDCQMPEMDGFEATQAIRSGGCGFADIPIIALTANALDGEKERCLSAGMDDYLAKPIKAEALGQKLEVWMSREAAVAS
jgi:two-component system sensor histidine kinase/response regulator